MKRRTALLAGIGLLLAGLLAGVLATLLLSDATQSAPQFVRRVQLGPSAPFVAAGSTAAPAPATSNDTFSADPGAPSSPLLKRVAADVRPSVVYIQVQSERPSLPDDGFHGFPNGGDDESEEGQRRRRFFGPQNSVGSGVIISPDGYIVTNNHVVDGAEAITVNLADRRRFEAEVVGTDPSTDMAVIRAKSAADLPALPIGDSDQVAVGEWVLAVGNPFRLTSTVTAGIVSALGRQVGIINDRFGIENFIQTDAAINPGNSGGALVNTRGELVGIATAIASEGGSYEGYGFAVPSNLVQRVARDLIERGAVERPLLGVSIRTVTPPMARRLKLGEVAGAYISDVQRGGAADQAGIQSGDVVQSVGARKVGAPNELQSAVARQRPGDTVRVKIWRDGAARTMAVTLLGRDAPAYQDWMNALAGNDRSGGENVPRGDRDAERPPPEDGGGGGAPQVFELEGWGLGLRALTTAEKKTFDRPEGVFLAYVADDGSAAEAGLPRGVVVAALNGTTVGSVESVLEVLKRASVRGEPVLLRVKRRDGTSAFYEVDPPR